MKRELVIIGAGPAGLTAAIYGRRGGLDTLVLERGLPGGQINATDEIGNWPGTIQSNGMELGNSFRKHAEHCGAEFKSCTVTGVKFESGANKIFTDEGEIEAEAVIIASGATFRKLGCPGEAEFTGMGVSYCAVCDGAFFEDETIAVVGGGNTAVKEANYLTRFAKKVYLIHRRDEWRADRHSIEMALKNPKIVPIWNSVVESIEGNGTVEKMVLKHVKTGEITELPVAGCFVFVGIEPNVSFLQPENSLLKQTKGGWIVTDEKMETSVEGVFAVGDVRDKYLRQVVTAAGDGAVAAVAAFTYVTEQLHQNSLLVDPEDLIVLVTSSVDHDQMKLLHETENYVKTSGKHIAFIDGYRYAKLADRYNIKVMPAIAQLQKGKVVRSEIPRTIDDVIKFIG
ncbi:MAG: thioredoxin-disulfide reductase [Synergistes sp.]|nr:thioredoxin-disulfide reductase [Synergistes sp.]